MRRILGPVSIDGLPWKCSDCDGKRQVDLCSPQFPSDFCPKALRRCETPGAALDWDRPLNVLGRFVDPG